jgi:subtilisin family serine protease
MRPPADRARRAAILAAVAILASAAAAADRGPAAGARVLHPALEEPSLSSLAKERSPFVRSGRPGWVVAKVRAADPGAFDPGGFERAARRLGAEVRAVAGGVASVEAPASALAALAAIPGVASVKPARAYRPSLDVSTADVAADAAAAAYGGTGRGVLVAVIDSGLDFRHLDFRRADGSSRVLAVWDQTDAAGGGAGCGPGRAFGRCWTRAELDADLAGGPAVPFRDGFGHGTHVTGIAAGNGLAAAGDVAPGTYAGVAPEAEILVVKVFTDSGDWAGDLTAAYGWIEERAAEQGAPFVINMSLGTDLGAHDGTDPDEISLDAILAPGAPGRAAAIAAGNSRGDGVHVQAAVGQGGTNDHVFQIPAYTPLPGPDNDAIYLDLWHEGGDALAVAVLDPNGSLLATAAAGSADGPVCTASGAVTLDARNTADADNGDGEILVVIADDGRCPSPAPPPPGRTMTLRVTGGSVPRGGGYHVWSESHLGAIPARIRFTPATESTLVGIPATAARATSVGSYVSRTCWPNGDPNTGTTCWGVSPPAGSASTFSSNGPTRDGRAKPEIAAPGEWVCSALSSVRPASGLQKCKGGLHWGLNGTSMAAPHAAGALAAILQHNPGLDAAQARDMLVAGARADAFTGNLPNSIFGSGKLSVLGGAEAVLKLVPGVGVDASGALAWGAEPHSAAYNVYRGDLPGSLPSSYGACLVSSLGSPSFDDPAFPAPGAGFHYLVTGVLDGIEGSLGFDGSGRPRPNVAPCE